MKVLEKIRGYQAGNIFIIFLLVQLGCVIAGILFPQSFRYLDQSNIQVLLKSIPPLAILVMGVNILMITGEFDLSVGAVFTFTAYIMATLFNMGAPAPVAAVAAIGVGAAIGALNGLIVVHTRIPSFIATLGSMMFWRGIILWFSGEKTAPFRPGGYFECLFSGSCGPMQVQFVWLLLIAGAAFMLLERHKLGNHFFGVGGNRDASLAVGLHPGRVKLAAFMLTGMAAAFSGIISTTRVHSVSPIQGEGMELQAIAACVIGGTALTGGKGTVLGPFLGAALIFTIQDVLLLVKAPGSYLEMFMGLLILATVVLNQLTSKR